MVDGVEGFSAFATWYAINLHFTTNYDFVKYKGKTRATRDTYNRRKDKFLFQKIQQHHSNHLKDYFIAQYIFHENLLKKPYIRNIATDGGGAYIAHRSCQDALTYHMSQQVNYWFQWLDDNQFDLMTVLKEQKTKVFNLFITDKLSIYFFAHLNMVTAFGSLWTPKNFNNPLWPGYSQRLNKYTQLIEGPSIIPALFKQIIIEREDFRKQLAKEP